LKASDEDNKIETGASLGKTKNNDDSNLKMSDGTVALSFKKS
jgi:hypothetical protein